jgi:hypothetical protein
LRYNQAIVRLGPNISSLLFYVKIFLIFGVGLALLFHAVTQEAMPWWPDTAIVGLYMGALAAIVAYGHNRDRRAWRRWRALARDTRLWWRTRNTV